MHFDSKQSPVLGIGRDRLQSECGKLHPEYFELLPKALEVPQGLKLGLKKNL